MKYTYLLTSLILGGTLFAALEPAQTPTPVADETYFLAPHIQAGLALCCGSEFVHIAEQEGILSIGTLAKQMAAGDTGVIVSPSSYDVVFTARGEDPAAIALRVQAACDALPTQPTHEEIQAMLLSFPTVYRATCTIQEGRLMLVQDLAQLSPGQEIWRKIGDTVTPSVYHTDEEYLIAMVQAGLRCEEIQRPCFFGKIKYRQYEEQGAVGELGVSYQDHNPFTIYHVRKG